VEEVAMTDTLGRNRVLWVDDQPDNNREARDKLEGRGIEVLTRRTTEEALRLLKSEPCDVIITDQRRDEDGVRNDTAGFELMRHVREADITVPVILSTATPDHEQARSLGFYGATSTQDGVVDFVMEILKTEHPQQMTTGPDDPETKDGRDTIPKPELPIEWVTIHADDPATVDELGRRPFAEVIAERIEEVWQASRAKGTGGDAAGAFMVHLHGPWGAGKTSVLNFLRAHLQDAARLSAHRWVVVEFNAWQQQRIRPPWWTLIQAMYAQSAQQLGLAQSVLLRACWFVWRARADWFPTLTAVVLILAAVLLMTGKPDLSETGSNGLAKTVELGLKILTAAFAVGAVVVTCSRSLVFGSARAAQMYTDLRSDPLRPIVGLFQKLVNAIQRPVVVFVDDLDRCESPYVIELLEGIQTLFRAAPVTYVVAADRKWLCASFEQAYEGFANTIGEPGRPLGYLFLDKMFQVSASIPRLSPEIQHRYWQGLLRTAASTDPKALDETRKHAEYEALNKVGNVHTQEELEAKIDEVRHDPVQEQAMRAAAAKQITRPEAQHETEHRLQRFADLLEPNPRSMKRLVNAYGLHQATHFLEGRRVSPDALARWTIIELRWPLLAYVLAARPQSVVDVANGQAPADGSLPHDVEGLFSDEAVKAVLVGDRVGGAPALDEVSIRQIIGLAHADGQPRRFRAERS
jgi:CheY-like chemotaxis protein